MEELLTSSELGQVKRDGRSSKAPFERSKPSVASKLCDCHSKDCLAAAHVPV